MQYVILMFTSVLTKQVLQKKVKIEESRKKSADDRAKTVSNVKIANLEVAEFAISIHKVQTVFFLPYYFFFTKKRWC